MTIAELDSLTAIFVVMKQSSQVRDGQAWINALAEVRLDLYLKITGTNADPFYDNSRIGLFFLTIYNPLFEIKKLEINYA